MLHVILLFLKILGIIFLVAAGLFLLILYAVFFSAIPYRMEAEKREKVHALFWASWFFRVVTVRVLLDEENGWEPVFQMRFFGFLLWQNVEEASRWKRLKRLRNWLKRKFQSRWRRRAPERQAEPDTEEPVGGEPLQNMEKRKEFPDEEAAEKVPEYERPEKNDIPYEKQKKKVFQKSGCAVQNVCDKIKRIWKKITGSKDAVRKILRRRDAFLEFWNLEEHRRARGAVLGEACYLWKKLGPKKVRGKITFGFADPAVTGLCMGAAGMLCAWYPKKFEIVPDFDREILEGELLMKGKARFYVIVRVLWRIYANEDIRSMYHSWQEL